jgi:pimeloyl-ACP methyl ester carboxylesterase
VRLGLEKSFYDGTKVTDERVAAYYRPLKTRGGQLASLRARAQWGMFPVEAQLNKINSPALIIWGAEDQLIPLEAGRKMNSLIRDSKLVILEKCGHVPQEELPESTLDEMTKFIEGTNQAKK